MFPLQQIVDRLNNNEMEINLLYDYQEGELILMNEVIGEHDDQIDIPETYFNMLEICEYPIDAHNHPNFNAAPSAMDIAFWLSNDEIREAIIVGENNDIRHFILPDEYVHPHTVETAYHNIIHQVAEEGKHPAAKDMFLEVSERLLKHFHILQIGGVQND